MFQCATTAGALCRLGTMGMVVWLAGCASHPKTASTPPAAQGASQAEARGDYRFEMTQDGRRMDADAFDAWMKARGIRVATGKPTAVPPAVATSHAKPVKARTAKARRRDEG